MADARPLRLLIVEARFYDHLADGLLAGARKAVEDAGAECDVVTVPGSLEIPPAIAYAAAASGKSGPVYHAYVALGCVIRGETYHFDVVANESSRALMDLAVNRLLPIGNGILTVENEAQALARIERSEGTSGESMGKGYFAAMAALKMAALKQQLGA